MGNLLIPFPVFDTQNNLSYSANAQAVLPNFAKDDFEITFAFLRPYSNNKRLFIVYCRETEHLLLWAWLVAKKSILCLKNKDIQKYIAFRLDPPVSWVSAYKCIRFIKHKNVRKPHPRWRPFRIKSDSNKYRLSQRGIEKVFTVLGKIYAFLLFERKIPDNSIILVLGKQKNALILKRQPKSTIKSFTEIQWRFLIKTAKQLAVNDPCRHEKTLFIIAIFYLLYPQPYELLARNNWTPQMNHFYQDSNQNWWFKVTGSRNNIRNIAVSDDMLSALKRYRLSRNLTPFPSSTDLMPLLVKKREEGAIIYIEELESGVQYCFNKTIKRLQKNNLTAEADTMKQASISWIRYTGISDDINKRGRPIEHVRDDAGHSISAVTSQYRAT